MNTECDSAKHFTVNTFEKMDSDEELDLMLLAVLLIKKTKTKKKEKYGENCQSCQLSQF